MFPPFETKSPLNTKVISVFFLIKHSITSFVFRLGGIRFFPVTFTAIVPPSPALTIGTGASGVGVPSCVLLPYTVRPHRGAGKASSTAIGLPVSVPTSTFCRAFTALIASPVAFASAASPSWVRVVSSATAGPGSPFSPLKSPFAMPSLSSCKLLAAF